jgi:glycosyltransferase involved in cell wall biosynthesis
MVKIINNGENMKISVVIVTKNRKDFLLRAIDSVINQTVKADEIIIVDDASDYNIEDLITSLTIENLKLIVNSKSLGGAIARNIGAKVTSGNILMFLDDDDAWDENKIKDQIKCFKDDNNLVIAYSGRKIVKDNNLNLVVRKAVSKKEGDISKLIFEKNYIGITSAVAIKKEIFDLVKGFDENLPCRQDYDLWIRISQYGNVKWDGEYNVIYTLFDNPSNQVSGRADKHEFVVKYLLKKYKFEIQQLDFILRRKSISEKYFSVLKSYSRNSILKSLKYAVKSFYYFPSIKAIVLLLPKQLLKKIGV